jgi:hypothetical protein
VVVVQLSVTEGLLGRATTELPFNKEPLDVEKEPFDSEKESLDVEKELFDRTACVSWT